MTVFDDENYMISAETPLGVFFFADNAAKQQNLVNNILEDILHIKRLHHKLPLHKLLPWVSIQGHKSHRKSSMGITTEVHYCLSFHWTGAMAWKKEAFMIWRRYSEKVELFFLSSEMKKSYRHLSSIFCEELLRNCVAISPQKGQGCEFFMPYSLLYLQIHTPLSGPCQDNRDIIKRRTVDKSKKA